MKNYLTEIKNLCTPAFVYLMLSVFSIIFLIFQNIDDPNTYCVGLYECDTDNIYILFILKIIYVIFWTFILNLLCNAGYKQFAWFLVVLPFLLIFVLIGLFMFNNNVRSKQKKN